MRQFLNILTLVLFFFSSCEEKIEWPLATEPTDLLVVEGMFTNIKTNHLVRLSHTYTDANDIPVGASGAIVGIFEENNFYPLTEFPVGSGFYFTDSIQAVADRVYGLYINYRGQEYTAFDVQVPVEPLTTSAFRPIDDGLFTLNLATSGSEPNYVRHFVNWTNTAQCQSAEDLCFAKQINYDLKTIDANEIFKPAKININFPANTIILRQKYSVSPGYRAFLRAILSETEWRGGIFDIQRANAVSNVSNDAVGYFAVSTVVSDTTLVQ